MIVESDKYWQYVCLSVSLCLPHSDSVSVSLPLTHCPSLCLTNCHTSPMIVPRYGTYLPTYLRYLSIYLSHLPAYLVLCLTCEAVWYCTQTSNQSSNQAINLHHSTDCTSIILIILMLTMHHHHPHHYHYHCDCRLSVSNYLWGLQCMLLLTVSQWTWMLTVRMLTVRMLTPLSTYNMY